MERFGCGRARAAVAVPGLDPLEFWRERGEAVWGPILTLKEFVDPSR